MIVKTILVIVIVIVTAITLAAVVGPHRTCNGNVRKNTTRIQMSSIKAALGNFKAQVGRFPTTSEGLDALVHRPSELSEKEWGENKYMDEAPSDPWGTDFYVCPSKDKNINYDLVSAGPDKKFGTKDDICTSDNMAASTPE